MMMRYNVILLCTCFLMCFNIESEGFGDIFVKKSTNDIGAYPYAKCNYDTIVVDHHFPESAVFLIPNHNVELKGEISQQDYLIRVEGQLFFKKVTDNWYNCTKNDSVQLHRITICKRNNTILRITNSKDMSQELAKIISPDIYKTIRDDFLLRMKYSKIKLNRNDVPSVILSWSYKIGKSE